MKHEHNFLPFIRDGEWSCNIFLTLSSNPSLQVSNVFTTEDFGLILVSNVSQEKGFAMLIRWFWILSRFLVKTPKQIVDYEKSSVRNLPKYERCLKTLNMILHLPFWTGFPICLVNLLGKSFHWSRERFWILGQIFTPVPDQNSNYQ